MTDSVPELVNAWLSKPAVERDAASMTRLDSALSFACISVLEGKMRAPLADYVNACRRKQAASGEHVLHLDEKMQSDLNAALGGDNSSEAIRLVNEAVSTSWSPETLADGLRVLMAEPR